MSFPCDNVRYLVGKDYLLSVDFLATDITKQFDDIYDSLIEGESQTGSPRRQIRQFLF